MRPADYARLLEDKMCEVLLNDSREEHLVNDAERKERLDLNPTP